MLKNKKKKKKGFTLIELVIVLAVLAIIALIAIPNFTKVRQDSMIKADQRTGDVIKRITLTMIADQKILVGNTEGTITITPGSGTTTTTAIASGGASFSTTTTGALVDGQADYIQELKEVGPPQQKGRTTYVVTIGADETIKSVETGPTAPTAP